MVGWQDLRSLGEAEFWVSHPRCGCFGDSAGLRLWLPGGLGDLPVLEAVSGPEPGLPQGLSSPIVLTSLCDWCGPPSPSTNLWWALCPGWEALTKLGGLGQCGVNEGGG